jgi:hypothetical protein
VRIAGWKALEIKCPSWRKPLPNSPTTYENTGKHPAAETQKQKEGKTHPSFDKALIAAQEAA